MPQQPAVIEAADLTVCIKDRPVLQDVTVTIPRNSVAVLLGRTGSGKSALLKSALGLLNHRAGSMQVLGLDPFHRRPARAIRAMCGYVPQNKNIYENFTVAEMCRFSKALYPTWKDHLEARLLDYFELPPHLKVRVLSPTNRAMLSTALALCHAPDLLLMDEPFDDVDPGAARTALQALVESVSEGHSTLLIATNNPERVEAIADRAMFFQSGRMVLTASVDEITSQWRLVTAHFTEDTPVLPSLPVSGVEYVRAEGRTAEWVMSNNSNESVAIIQKLGAISVQVHPLSLTTLFSRFLR